MAQKLVPCPACRRHLVLGEPRCPFCRASLPEDLSSALIPAATRRLSRAAAFVFTTSLTVAGCSSTTSSSDANLPDTQTVTDNGPPADSRPLIDAQGMTEAQPLGDTPTGTDTRVTTDTQTSTDTRVTTDTQTSTDTGSDGPEDRGNIAPPYGIAVDAGFPDDDGGFKADYGAPPPPMDAGL